MLMSYPDTCFSLILSTPIRFFATCDSLWQLFANKTENPSVESGITGWGLHCGGRSLELLGWR